MNIRKRRVGKHKKGCMAQANVESGAWNSVWSFLPTPRFLNRAGYGKGLALWVEIPCNDLDCPALLLLNGEDILEAVGESRGRA